jgi:DNA-binding MarR family transcriptional regulator
VAAPDNPYAAAAQVCACLNFRRTARAVTRLFDATLEPSGLRSTQFVMLVSIRAEGEVDLPALAAFIGLERSVLTRRLTPLVRDGLVRKVASKTGRATRVRLTPKGRRRLERAVPLWQEAQGHFVDQVGDARWKDMLSDLTAAQAAAGEKRPRPGPMP